jgi:hypothetical protein
MVQEGRAQVVTMPADHRITWAHLGTWTLAALGARDVIHDDPNGLLMFRIGSGRPYRKLLVTLCADDTYRVERGHVAGMDWVTDEVVTGIHAAQLSETARTVGERR